MNWKALTWFLAAIASAIALSAMTNSLTISKNHTLAQRALGKMFPALEDHALERFNEGPQISLGVVSSRADQTFPIIFKPEGRPDEYLSDKYVYLTLLPIDVDVRVFSTQMLKCKILYPYNTRGKPKSIALKAENAPVQYTQIRGKKVYFFDIPAEVNYWDTTDMASASDAFANHREYDCVYAPKSAIFYNSNYQKELKLNIETSSALSEYNLSKMTNKPIHDRANVEKFIGNKYFYPGKIDFTARKYYVDNFSMTDESVFKFAKSDTESDAKVAYYRGLYSGGRYIFSWEDPASKQWRDIALVIIGGLFGLFATFVIEAIKAINPAGSKASRR